MFQTLENATRKAKKPYKCWHCYRTIEAGTRYGLQTNVCDGEVYTLRWHLDCNDCWQRHIDAGGVYSDDGYPPLRDDWVDSGEYERVCDIWRGYYPHVIARMELTDQLFMLKNA